MATVCHFVCTKAEIRLRARLRFADDLPWPNRAAAVNAVETRNLRNAPTD